MPKYSNRINHHDSKAELAGNSIEAIKNTSNQFNIKIMYLPTYSPDLNPIEKK
ncbi:MAG: hypothetical protein HOH73_04725 [Alphaproteobacteria bacterium]|nr:hypothetical protein [Alphaproteobacteria bacterium]